MSSDQLGEAARVGALERRKDLGVVGGGGGTEVLLAEAHSELLHVGGAAEAQQACVVAGVGVDTARLHLDPQLAGSVDRDGGRRKEDLEGLRVGLDAHRAVGLDGGVEVVVDAARLDEAVVGRRVEAHAVAAHVAHHGAYVVDLAVLRRDAQHNVKGQAVREARRREVEARLMRPVVEHGATEHERRVGLAVGLDGVLAHETQRQECVAERLGVVGLLQEELHQLVEHGRAQLVVAR